MSALSTCLQQLFDFLAGRQLSPRSRDVRLVEIHRDTTLDEHGRFRIPRSALREPAEYEARFDELAKFNLPWINMSCYGIHEGLLIVGIEIPEGAAGERQSPRLTVNYSGPTASVLQHDWEISSIAVIE